MFAGMLASVIFQIAGREDLRYARNSEYRRNFSYLRWT